MDRPNRRGLLMGVGALPLLLAPVGLRAQTAEWLIERDPPCGPVRGRQKGNVARYLGIPFAKPPIGPLRFRAPVPAPRWRERRELVAFAPSPIQPGAVPEDATATLPTSEDCLYLNVWAPSAPGQHPVYVWVHGGGNITGSTRFPVFDGTPFAEAGIVCVTLTYRVGSFGFLDLGSVLGSDYADSGNNGLRDLILGLEWVRNNIAAFGGNPGNVTLGGQSAGAKNVVALVAAPAAKGLFARAIIESGGGQTVADQARAGDLTARIAAAAGVSPNALLDLPASAILAAQTRVIAEYPRKYPFRAVIGGHLLADAPTALIAKGAGRHTPLLIGWNHDEVAFWEPPAPGKDAVGAGELANMGLDRFLPIQAAYSKLHPPLSPGDRRIRSISMEEYGVPTLRLAEAQARAGGQAYLYRFDMGMTGSHRHGYAIHGAELPLAWAMLGTPAAAVFGPAGPDAERLSHTMHAMWLAFLRGKAPSASWPTYAPGARITMRFGADGGPVADPDRDERLLWIGKL